MREQSRDSSTHGSRGDAHTQHESVPLQQARRARGWQQYAMDSLLALVGVALVTAVIAIVHLYPRLPSIVLIYLLVIIGLASVRGSYAAVLAALLGSMSFDFFFTPPLYEFSFVDLSADELLDPWVFVATGLITGGLTVAQRRHAEQAKYREREARLLSVRAQELAALQERQRLARELHDSVSQVLYGINLGTRAAREALDGDPGEAIAPLEYVIALTEAGLAEMRALILELRPESLASEGLINALSKQVAVLRTRYKLSVNAELDDEPTLPLENKQALYRIAQEALHNIVKHACASRVTLRLARQNGKLLLEVGDDGEGFDPTQSFPGHLGLHLMQERVAQLGGICSIESAPAQGTRLQVSIPIP